MRSRSLDRHTYIIDTRSISCVRFFVFFAAAVVRSSGSRGLLVDLMGRGHEERLTWSAPPLSVCLSTAFFVAALPRQVRRGICWWHGAYCFGPLLHTTLVLKNEHAYVRLTLR